MEDNALSMAELQDIAMSAFADDVPLEDQMLGWTREQACIFFESGGQVRPEPSFADGQDGTAVQGDDHAARLASVTDESKEQCVSDVVVAASASDASSDDLVREYATPPIRRRSCSVSSKEEDAATGDLSGVVEPDVTTALTPLMLPQIDVAVEAKTKPVEVRGLTELAEGDVAEVNAKLEAGADGTVQAEVAPKQSCNGDESVVYEYTPSCTALSGAHHAAATFARSACEIKISDTTRCLMMGTLPLEWANCELLQPLLAMLLPDAELEAKGALLLDIPTTQLLKLGDADQQCEALLNGPQCAVMRRRLKEAELVLALINDNDDPEVASGGGHWSAVAWRRDSWRDGVFMLEHYDPSGDIELNADAAGLLGSSLAERLSELSEQDVDRTEIWRMKVPMQHDNAICGMTAACYLHAIFSDHCERRAATCRPVRSGGPASPAAVLSILAADVEALRLEVARAWVPHALAPAEAYAAQLTAQVKMCSSHCEVVFDVYEDEEDEDCFVTEDDDESDNENQCAASSPKSITASCGTGDGFERLLQAAAVSGSTIKLLLRSTKLATCAQLVSDDRPGFLRFLKQLGAAKLNERQAIANTICKAIRSGQLVAPFSAPFLGGVGASATSTASAAPVLSCDRCGGAHAAALCPHFKQARGSHPDAVGGARYANSTTSQSMGTLRSFGGSMSATPSLSSYSTGYYPAI